MFLRSAISLLKITILFVLAYLFIALFFAHNVIQLAIGFFVLIFITLPTIFVIFFKHKFLIEHPGFTIYWKIICVIYIISIALFISGLIVGEYRSYEQDKTNKVIEFINSKKITLTDVLGKNLPPQPDQKINDSTIAGIDANKNYIRDDVELAIFKEYPNSAKIRAAELQYAQALQLEITQVDSSPTLIPVMQKEDSSYFCLGDVIGVKTMKGALAILDEKDREINSLVLNTNLRKSKDLGIFNKFMTGYSLPTGDGCIIEASSLPN